MINNKCDWEIYIVNKQQISLIFLINVHRYDIRFDICRNADHRLQVVFNIISELPIFSTITVPQDIYTQLLLREDFLASLNVNSNQIYDNYLQKDQIVETICETLTHLFVNQDEIDIFMYVNQSRLAILGRRNTEDVIN